MTKHESMRGYFAYELYQQMASNPDIILLVGDLGYLMFDKIRDDYPKQFINVGAAESSMLDIAVGLAYSGKKVFVYSITNFLLYRPFETIRTYIDHEKLPIVLCGSGRNKDYHIDGYSHQSEDAKQILDCLPNIKQLWPDTKEEIPLLVKEMVESKGPVFISLKR